MQLYVCVLGNSRVGEIVMPHFSAVYLYDTGIMDTNTNTFNWNEHVYIYVDIFFVTIVHIIKT